MIKCLGNHTECCHLQYFKVTAVVLLRYFNFKQIFALCIEKSLKRKCTVNLLYRDQSDI